MKLLFKIFLIFLLSSSFNLYGQTKFEFLTGLTYPINYSEKNLAREIGFKIGIELISNMSKNISISYGLNVYSYLQTLPNYKIVDCRTALNTDYTANCSYGYYIDKSTIEKNLSAGFGAELPLLVGTNLTRKLNISTGIAFCLDLSHTGKKGSDPDLYSNSVFTYIAYQRILNWCVKLKYNADDRISFYLNFQNPFDQHSTFDQTSKFGLITLGLNYNFKGNKSAANTYKQWRAFPKA